MEEIITLYCNVSQYNNHLQNNYYLLRIKTQEQRFFVYFPPMV